MKITRTFDWCRRDFSFDAKCENPDCGEQISSRGGYDDDNYYNNVIPNLKCKKCGKSSVEMGTFEKEPTRYDPNVVM
jgi:hypothetical protein